MSWDSAKLGDLVEVLDTLRKPITKRNRIAGEYPYYGATGIVDWVNDYIFEEELVLIGEDGAKWESGEKTAFIVKGKYWVNNHAHVVKPDENKLLNSWLEYYLYFIDLKPWVTGLTVPKLNQANLKSIPIPIPPLQTQKQIVEKLDAAFADIHKAISATEKNIENAEALFQKSLHSIFFGETSNNWNKNSLKELSDKITDGSHNPPKGIEVSNYLMLSARNVFNDRLNFDKVRYLSKMDFNSENKRTNVQEGDVLLTIVGTIGRSLVFPKTSKNITFQRSVALIKPKQEIINSHFLKYFFISINDFLNKNSRGAAQKGIYLKALSEIEVNHPNYETQNKLVNKFKIIDDQTNKIIDIYSRKIDELINLKSSILNQAFSGKLTKDAA
tara:strand:+ start:542 stop:1699 length:1158 start_codon:yes stop_codon:yes gene_type:complete